MLEEMASERISWLWNTKIASRNPRSSLDHIVLIIKCRHRKVIINWMNFESFERVYWCARPLPNISCRVIYSPDIKMIYRWWCRVSEANISLIFLEIILNMFQYCIMLIFCWEPYCLPSLLGEPPTISGCFKAINFNRIVPRKRWSLKES
jgi:hypothetical protein